MGIRYMSKEREDNLVAVNVCGHGCVEGIFNCEGRFDTSHEYSDGFKPDDGWYRIADYMVGDLRRFKSRGIEITYDDTCKEIKDEVEREWSNMIGYVRICAPEKLVTYHSDNGYERGIPIGGNGRGIQKRMTSSTNMKWLLQIQESKLIWKGDWNETIYNVCLWNMWLWEPWFWWHEKAWSFSSRAYNREMESYRALKSFVAHIGSVMATKNNENTRRQFDEAVEKLIAFEKEYGITK